MDAARLFLNHGEKIVPVDKDIRNVEDEGGRIPHLQHKPHRPAHILPMHLSGYARVNRLPGHIVLEQVRPFVPPPFAGRPVDAGNAQADTMERRRTKTGQGALSLKLHLSVERIRAGLILLAQQYPRRLCSIDSPAREERDAANACRLRRLKKRNAAVEIAPAEGLRIGTLAAAVFSRQMVERAMNEEIRPLEKLGRCPGWLK